LKTRTTIALGESGRDIARGEGEKAGGNINIGTIQAENVQIANRASIRQEVRPQNETTKRTTWDTIWGLVKKVLAIAWRILTKIFWQALFSRFFTK
jgi:hypothetical protein